MAGVGIAGCLLTFAVLGRDALGTGTFEWFIETLGVLTVGFGIAALIAETTWALLVPMMAGLVTIWAAALMHDARYIAPARAVRHAWSAARSGTVLSAIAGHPLSSRGQKLLKAGGDRHGQGDGRETVLGEPYRVRGRADPARRGRGAGHC